MTRRLRDLDSPSAEEAKLVELVRAARPTTRSDAHMRRVRAELDVTPSKRPAWEPGWALSAVLPLLLVAGIAAASAMAARAWLEQQRAATEAAEHKRVRNADNSRPPPMPEAPPAPPTQSAAASPLATPDHQPLRGPSADGESREATPAPASVARATRSRRLAQAQAELQRPRGNTPRSQATYAAVAPADVAAPDDDAPLRGVRIVSSALHAMRKSHEPKAASDLLERYLNEEPGGPFAEEALGLAIEAAADGDEPQRAASRARRYLETYPSGRFVSIAQRALRRFSTRQRRF